MQLTRAFAGGRFLCAKCPGVISWPLPLPLPGRHRIRVCLRESFNGFRL